MGIYWTFHDLAMMVSKYVGKQLGKWLLKHNEIGQRLQAIHKKTGMILLACDKCAIERQIDDKLVKGTEIGCFPILYASLGSAGID